MPPAIEGVELGDDVLEVGPGLRARHRGARRRALAELTGARDRLRAWPARLRARLGDRARSWTATRTAMPFEDESFSAAVCFTMLHHVPPSAGQDRLFAEVRRVLRPGGVFAGTDSVGRGLGFALLHVGDTKNLIAPDDMPARLAAAGFGEIDVSADRDSYRFRALWEPRGFSFRPRGELSEADVVAWRGRGSSYDRGRRISASPPDCRRMRGAAARADEFCMASRQLPSLPGGAAHSGGGPGSSPGSAAASGSELRGRERGDHERSPLPAGDALPPTTPSARRHGLGKVRWNRALARVASKYSRTMVANHFFDHYSPSHRDHMDRIAASSYRPDSGCWTAGENLFFSAGVSTPRQLIKAWMGSAVHRRDILRSGWRDFGLGVAYGSPYGGSGMTVVALFGVRSRPAARKPEPASGRRRPRTAARVSSRRRGCRLRRRSRPRPGSRDGR